MHRNGKELPLLIIILSLFGCSSFYHKNMQRYFINKQAIVSPPEKTYAFPLKRIPPDYIKKNFEKTNLLTTTGRHKNKKESVYKEGVNELYGNPRLSDYLAYAAVHNPGLKAAFNRWKAALARIPQVESLPDPRLNYAYFIKEVETRAGPQRQKIGLSQTFPWFGKLSLRGKAAMQTAKAEKENYELAKLKLFYKVKKAYYEYYYLARSIAIIEENLDLLKNIEEIARVSYSANTGSYQDIIKIQVEIAKTDDRRKSLVDLRSPLVAKLNAALNRPERLPLPWPKTVLIEQVDVSENSLVLQLKKTNPELKAKTFILDREKTGIDIAKKDYFPDITFGLEWIDTRDAMNAGTRDSGKDPIIAMFSINLPIWYSKYHATVEEAKARRLKVQMEHKERENSLLSDLKMAIYRFRDSERKINLYHQQIIPRIKQSLEVSLKALKVGDGSVLDVIDAQRMLLEFQLFYERAVADREEKLARIEMLVGKNVPRLDSHP